MFFKEFLEWPGSGSQTGPLHGMTQSRRHWGQRGGVSWQLSLSHAERFRDIMHAIESCFETSAPEQPVWAHVELVVIVSKQCGMSRRMHSLATHVTADLNSCRGFEGARASVLVCHGVLPCIFRWAATGPVPSSVHACWCLGMVICQPSGQNLL